MLGFGLVCRRERVAPRTRAPGAARKRPTRRNAASRAAVGPYSSEGDAPIRGCVGAKATLNIAVSSNNGEESSPDGASRSLGSPGGLVPGGLFHFSPASERTRDQEQSSPSARRSSSRTRSALARRSRFLGGRSMNCRTAPSEWVLGSPRSRSSDLPISSQLWMTLVRLILFGMTVNRCRARDGSC